MEIETTIAQGIHATNDSAGYDEACKRILSEKSVLARIMKACLEEYKDCYEKIKKVYSIWICMDPPNYRANTITQYRLMEENLIGKVVEPVDHYDLLSIVMICLGGPEQANYSGILRMLDVLLSHETSEAEKKRVLQNDYGIPMTETIEREVSLMCNLSKGVEEKGIAKGMTTGILSSIKNLMETMGLTIEQAMAGV